MAILIRPWAPADREALRAAIHEPELAAHFDKFLGPEGLEHKLHDRRLAKEGIRIAEVDGVLAGFGVPWLLPQAGDVWTMLRVGVRGPFRRRGVGTRLAESLLEFAGRGVLAGGPAGPGATGRVEVAGSAWMPNAASERIAAKLGFAHERWFWLMERPRGGAPGPEWPAGIEIRVFDRGEGMLEDWRNAYNDSFAAHYRFVVATAENTRAIVEDPTFRADGVALAYLEGRCVGFCRNESHATRGEIAVLGTTHDARGLGLGRALLRWGVRWLEANVPGPVTLLVDGDNEAALKLYRSEGFEISRTRRIWGRVLEAGA
jgi:mycothiol synthase